MKSLVIGLMLIAVVSCATQQQQRQKFGRKRDVSEVFQGQGWSKGPDGYNYDKPKIGLPELKIAADPEPIEIEEEEKSCPNGGSGSFCCINGVENEFCCENGAANQYCCENGVENQYCCENGAENKDCILPTQAPAEPPAEAPADAPEADYLPPVQNDYLPPSDQELREYLPPARRRLRLQRRYRFVRRQ